MGLIRAIELGDGYERKRGVSERRSRRGQSILVKGAVS